MWRHLGLAVIAEEPCDPEPQAARNDVMFDVPEMVAGIVTGMKFPFVVRSRDAQVFTYNGGG